MKSWFTKTKQGSPDLRESFSLPYSGGEIWVSCLDNLGDNVELIKTKIINDEKLITRPSNSSFVLYHLDGTEITYEIAGFIIESLRRSGDRVRKLALVGVTREGKKNIKKHLTQSGVEFRMPVKYFSGVDPAKEWLVKGR